jgi:crossover junction endodeoxyribonuclease RuvC
MDGSIWFLQAIGCQSVVSARLDRRRWAELPGVGVTAKQYEMMQARLLGRGRSAGAACSADRPADARRHEVILGIDPSLRGTGYGVIRLARPHPIPLAHGTIVCPAEWGRSRCLLHIAQELRGVTRRFRPTACVVEGLFYAQNLRTALVMGEARGAALVAAAEAGLEIFEIAPRKVKLAIAGHGGAHKSAVAKMVQRLVGLAEAPAPDAADALALALTHAQEQAGFALVPPKRL